MCRRLIILVSLLLTIPLFAHPADPTGHWEGLIHAPGTDVRIETDFVKSPSGGLSGTFNNPARGVRGFPLSTVTASGSSVTFEIKAAGGGTFTATLDGASMKGTFTTRGTDGQPLELPFELQRTGDAQAETISENAAVSKALEGTWAGTLEVEGRSRPLELKITNLADGTATAQLSAGDGIEIRVTRIAQKERAVTLEVASIAGSFEGTLDSGTTELAGTWTQGAFVAPLTFRRVAIGRSAKE